MLDVFRQTMNYGDLKRRVIHMARLWGADRVIIENAASGIMLLRELRQERAIAGKLRSFVPKVDKELRFETQIARRPMMRIRVVPSALPHIPSGRARTAMTRADSGS